MSRLAPRSSQIFGRLAHTSMVCRSRIPVFVDTAQQAVDCARLLGKPIGPSSAARLAYRILAVDRPADSLIRLCPIFMVSNVTGHNLPMLRTFLNCLPSSQMDDRYVKDAPFEFQISDVFSVPFVGTVVVSTSLTRYNAFS